MKIENPIQHEHAVSETVGFILIFGIMLTGIGLITLYGYPALLDAQQNANIRNMERNMISLQSDVKSLVYKSVPYKETTMQVSGGVLSVESPDPANPNSPYIQITDGGGNQLLTAFPDGKFPPGSLQFLSETSDVAIALQNGAVVKWQIGETGQPYKPSVMLSKPRWFIDESGGIRTLVITLIQINPEKPLSTSGISTVQMKMEPLIISDPDGNPNSGDESTYFDNAPAGNIVRISIPITDRYFKGWANYVYFDLIKKSMPEPTPPIWDIDNIDRLIIKGYSITVLGL